MGSMTVQCGSRGSRFATGWRSRDQDKAQHTRVARAEKQNFLDIRNECLSRGALFEDPDFPAVNKSIYYSYDPGSQFEWKRPGDIGPEPRMFVGGASRFDIKQGDLGNCWFLAAIASLCATANASHGKNKYLLSRIVHEDNSFVDSYAGVVHFQLWQYGRWVDVVIDDRLPTSNGQLVFMHSAEPNEFWSALLEKAYAKLNGSYEALQGGCSSEAMEDFTGGICETFNFQTEVPTKMFTIMKKADERGSLMGCTIDADPSQIEAVLDNGLVMGHAYSVTGVKEFSVGGSKVQLVRVRNPWGNQHEWKGAWSDSSPEWKKVSEAQRKEFGINFSDDGEFWMSFGDFTREFHRLEICNLSPDALEDEAVRQSTSKRTKWEASIEDGSWKPRVNAGGCRNFLESFWTNPQYRVEVIDADEEDDSNHGTIIIGLLQKERRKKKVEGCDMLTIGYTVYKIEDPKSGPLDLNFFKYNRAIAKSPTFSNMREICGRHKLVPGAYCVIPSTFQPQEEGDFLLRIFSEKPNKTGELDETTGLVEEHEPVKGDISVMAQPAPQSAKKATSTTTITIQAEPERRRRRARAVTQDDVDEEKKVREVFRRKAGPDLEVDAYELREILDEQLQHEMKLRPRFRFGGFSLETCRSLVAMMDIDHSGKLGYEEFKKLWADVRMWKKIFNEFDQDGNGTFNSFELRQALNSAGIRVSNHTFNCLVMRYSGPQGKIFFDDYLLCAARLKTMFANFKDASDQGRDDAHFGIDQFVQTTMYS